MEQLTLDVVDIDGAVDMASNLTLAGDRLRWRFRRRRYIVTLDIVDIDGAVNYAADVTLCRWCRYRCFNGTSNVDV